MKRTSCLLFILGLALTAGSAAARPLISVMAGKRQGEGGIRLQNTVREHAVRVEFEELAEDPDTFEIRLPGSPAAVAVRDRSWHRSDGSMFWTGQVFASRRALGEPLGLVRLSLQDGRLSAAVEIADRRFEVLPAVGGGHRLVELPAVPAPPRKKGESEVTSEPHSLPIDTAPPAPAELSRIDVLALYPKHYLTEDPNVDDKIRSWFDDANLVFANSLVNARYEPVYVGPLLGEQPPIATRPGAIGVAMARDWLVVNTPPEVTGLRSQFGADLVVLFVPGDETIYCGRAKLEDTEYPFAAIEIDCHRSEYLVAHELGHVLGLRHEVQADADGTYGHGFDKANALRRIKGRRAKGRRAATVMACNGDNNGEVHEGNLFGNQCNRIPYLSAPRTVPGVIGPIGNATQADNARWAREQAPVFAALRTPTTDPDLPPRISIERPTPGSILQVNQFVTYAARAFDPEDGDLSNSIRWRSSYSGAMGTGREIRSRVYDTSGRPRYVTVTAEVTDSAGQLERVSRTYLVTRVTSPYGGIWFSKEAPGELVTFNQNSQGEWVLIWFTPSGSSSSWYLSRTATLPSTGAWSAELDSYVFDASTGTPTEQRAGTVTLLLETDRQVRVIVRLTSGATRALLLDPFTLGSEDSGIYYAERADGSVDPGLVIIRGVMADDRNLLLSLVATFDGSQPTWAYGHEILIVVGEIRHEAKLFQPSPDPNGAFDPTYAFQLPLGVDGTSVGLLTYSGDRSQVGIGLTFPSGNDWTRGRQPLRRITIR